MHRIDFGQRLTALKIKEHLIAVSQKVATDKGLFAKFDQSQQPAFVTYSGSGNNQKRTRIGNAKHKQWLIHYQTTPPSKKKSDIVGTLVIRGAIDPSNSKYGGFDYGKTDKTAPTYDHITIGVPSEFSAKQYVDATAGLLITSVVAIEKAVRSRPKRPKQLISALHN